MTNACGDPGLPASCNIYAGTITVSVGVGETETWSDTEGAEQFLLTQAQKLGFGKVLGRASAPGEIRGHPA